MTSVVVPIVAFVDGVAERAKLHTIAVEYRQLDPTYEKIGWKVEEAEFVVLIVLLAIKMLLVAVAAAAVVETAVVKEVVAFVQMYLVTIPLIGFWKRDSKK